MHAEDYEITPANSSCENTNKTVIVSNPGSQINHTQTNVDAVKQQHIEDSKYDSDQLVVKPLYGGSKKFYILFRHKTYIIENTDEIKALKQFLNNSIYKKDYILKISDNHTVSYYIIRRNQKNKFKKIYF